MCKLIKSAQRLTYDQIVEVSQYLEIQNLDSSCRTTGSHERS